MVPLLAVVLLIAAALILGSARLGTAVVARARADSVADMVALAAVPGGREGACAVAAANGAQLVRHVGRADGSIMVEVRMGAVAAVAAAAPGN
ncbi:MAG: hypothetical protein WBF71_14765 [Microthrixaceae bacterium]